MNMKKQKSKKKHQFLKGFGITVLVILALVAGLFITSTFHTQMVVGMVQKLSNAAFEIEEANSFSPISETMDTTLEDGKRFVSNIQYGDTYPNSFFDITYDNKEDASSLPTLIYFHGGGFFGGSKTLKDPMAVSSFSYLTNAMMEEGYNLVNADYGLVPDCLFPVPLEQMSQLLQYLQDHEKELGLNMNNVVLMGQSAGAIMVSQYGAILSNPAYARRVGVEPAIKPEQVKCLIIDDAPLDYSHFSLETKYLVGNYINGSIYVSKEEMDRYEPYAYVTAEYPPAVLLGSDEYGYDMAKLHQVLDEKGVANLLIRPLDEGIHTPHCFIGALETDPTAQKAFSQMMEFVNQQTKGEAEGKAA